MYKDNNTKREEKKKKKKEKKKKNSPSLISFITPFFIFLILSYLALQCIKAI